MKESKEHIDNFELPDSLKELQGKNPFTVPDNFFSNQKIHLEAIAQRSAQPIRKVPMFSMRNIAIAASIILLFSLGVIFIINNTTNPNDPEIADDNTQIENVNQDDYVIPNSIADSNPNSNDENDENVENQNSADKDYTIEQNQNGTQIAVDNRRNKTHQYPNQNTPYDNQIDDGTQKASNDFNFPNNNSPESRGTNQKGGETDVARVGENSPSVKVDLGSDTCGFRAFKLIAKTNKDKRTYYLWSTGETTSSITVRKTGKYWVKASAYQDMQYADWDTVEVTMAPKPSRALGSDIEICSHESAFIVSLSENEHYSYDWNLQNEDISTLELNNLKPGLKEVTLRVSYCGQSIKDGIVVKVNNCDIDITNVITPNNDGRNDKFVITGLENYPGTELIIQDRSGKVVYHSKNYQNDWDGAELPAGPYFYILRLADGNNNDVGGTITIVR